MRKFFPILLFALLAGSVAAPAQDAADAGNEEEIANRIESLLAEPDPQRRYEQAQAALEIKGLQPEEWYYIAATLAQAAAQTEAGDIDSLVRRLEPLFNALPERRDLFVSVMLDSPAALVESGHLEPAFTLLDALYELEWTEDEREEIASLEDLFAHMQRLLPLLGGLSQFLEASPFPPLEEATVEYASASELETAARTSPWDLNFHLRLRKLFEFGPQLTIPDDLASAAIAANGWMAASSEDPDLLSTPPESLETLLDLLTDFWEASLFDASDQIEVRFLRADIVRRREGPEAVLDAWQTIASDLKLSQEQRAEALERMGRHFEAERDLDGFLSVGHQLAELSGVRAQVVPQAYLLLAARRYDEALARFDVANQLSPEEIPSGAALPVTEILTDQAAALRWWKRSENWWGEWEALARTLELDLLDTHWSGYAPWRSNDEAEITEFLATLAPGPFRQENVGVFLRVVMEHARWHPSGAADAADFLRNQAAEAFPESQAVLEELATRLSPN